MEWSRDTSWRQGYLLGDDAVEALGLLGPYGLEQTVVIVATHDCDLAQHPDSEPCIEVVIGCPAQKNGNFTHAKNSRKLHIEFDGEAPFWAEFTALARTSIDKWALVPFKPRADVRLTPDNYAIFQMWLASRYRRSAFPDEFERRLAEGKLDEKIAKAVKPHGELISGIFFDVDGGEEVARIGPQDTYTLDITVLHSADDFLAAEKAATDAATAIADAFKGRLFDPVAKVWQQIELRFCDPISESTLTYEEFKRLRRWRLEHLSLAADPQQPVLAE